MNYNIVKQGNLRTVPITFIEPGKFVSHAKKISELEKWHKSEWKVNKSLVNERCIRLTEPNLDKVDFRCENPQNFGWSFSHLGSMKLHQLKWFASEFQDLLARRTVNGLMTFVSSWVSDAFRKIYRSKCCDKEDQCAANFRKYKKYWIVCENIHKMCQDFRYGKMSGIHRRFKPKWSFIIEYRKSERYFRNKRKETPQRETNWSINSCQMSNQTIRWSR